MAARAIWKGTLHVGSLTLPLKLYSAVQERSVHFRLLDAHKHERVEQKMVHPGTGQTVERTAVQKGFPLDDGSFVTLEPEELASLEPEASRDITTSRLVPSDAVSRALFVRPYYLGPDGRSAEYFALASALESAKLDGIAHWVMRKHGYHGALFAKDGYLLLATLRPAAEIVSADALPKPTGRAHSERELSMAEQLIQSYSGPLDLASFHDEYRERVLEFVKKKAEGKRVRIPRAPAKKSEGSLVDALARSLKQTKKPAAHRKHRKVA
jgi:DNA end-binding protein Ku